MEQQTDTKSNHTRLAQSWRGEAFANRVCTEQAAVSQMFRPYATPCALSQDFVVRFRSLRKEETASRDGEALKKCETRDREERQRTEECQGERLLSLPGHSAGPVLYPTAKPLVFSVLVNRYLKEHAALHKRPRSYLRNVASAKVLKSYLGRFLSRISNPRTSTP